MVKVDIINKLDIISGYNKVWNIVEYFTIASPLHYPKKINIRILRLTVIIQPQLCRKLYLTSFCPSKYQVRDTCEQKLRLMYSSNYASSLNRDPEIKGFLTIARRFQTENKLQY